MQAARSRTSRQSVDRYPRSGYTETAQHRREREMLERRAEEERLNRSREEAELRFRREQMEAEQRRRKEEAAAVCGLLTALGLVLFFFLGHQIIGTVLFIGLAIYGFIDPYR